MDGRKEIREEGGMDGSINGRKKGMEGKKDRIYCIFNNPTSKNTLPFLN